MLCIYSLSLLTLLVKCQNLEKSRSIWVEQGLIRGKIYKISENYMQIFRGIPYAEPPIGELRFKKPVKRSRWHQEYSAVDFGPPCLQFMNFYLNDKFSMENMEHQSEDCLVLNVFSPYDPEDEGKLYPVLVWIHGGSFLAGSGDTGIDMEVIANNFIFKGVVVVTLNYRLGPLGFLSYEVDGNMEGNFGIWDQVMALEWIQANAKQLNGDPSKVTVMGESAGAAAASLLAVSPVTKGLLHQVIALSGSATAGWAIHRHSASEWDARNMVQYLRCEKSFSEEQMKEIMLLTDTTEEPSHCNLQTSIPGCIEYSVDSEIHELIDCLRNHVNFSSIPFRLALANELGIAKMVIDNTLVRSAGYELIEKYANLPIMIGVAEREWANKKAFSYNFPDFNNITLKHVMENIRMIVDKHFHSGASKKLPESMHQLIANSSYYRYVDAPDGNLNAQRVITALQTLEADIEFVAPAQREIDAYAANNQPVYAYSFTYMPQSPFVEEQLRKFALFGQENIKITRKEARTIGNATRKAFHGLDQAFIFTRGYTNGMQITPFSKRDIQMSHMMATMLSNFTKHGNPTTTSWNGFNWPMYSKQSTRYAILNIPPREKVGSIHWPTTNFWNKEIEFIEKHTISDKVPMEDDELSSEERLQLAAYRRAWWALWLLVAIIALVIWIGVICVVVTRCHSPRAKPYNNIIVNG